jgi:hypothetical protein
MIMRGSMALRTHCHAAVDVSMVAARMRDQCAAVKALAASAVGLRDRPLAKRAPAIAVWMQPASFSHRREVFNDALWSLDKYGPKMIVATVGLGVNAVDLTRRGVRDAGAFHWRRHLVSLILTALVAVVLPTSVVACGTSTSAGHNSPSPASNTTHERRTARQLLAASGRRYLCGRRFRSASQRRAGNATWPCHGHPRSRKRNSNSGWRISRFTAVTF